MLIGTHNARPVSVAANLEIDRLKISWDEAIKKVQYIRVLDLSNIYVIVSKTIRSLGNDLTEGDCVRIFQLITESAIVGLSKNPTLLDPPYAELVVLLLEELDYDNHQEFLDDVESVDDLVAAIVEDKIICSHIKMFIRATYTTTAVIPIGWKYGTNNIVLTVGEYIDV